jgi:hypothetical protein
VLPYLGGNLQMDVHHRLLHGSDGLAVSWLFVVRVVAVAFFGARSLVDSKSCDFQKSRELTLTSLSH